MRRLLCGGADGSDMIVVLCSLRTIASRRTRPGRRVFPRQSESLLSSLPIGVFTHAPLSRPRHDSQRPLLHAIRRRLKRDRPSELQQGRETRHPRPGRDREQGGDVRVVDREHEDGEFGGGDEWGWAEGVGGRFRMGGVGCDGGIGDDGGCEWVVVNSSSDGSMVW